MKTIIIYTSSNGCTERAVHELSQKLSGEVETVDLMHHHSLSLNEFDRIIIGGSIHSGKIQQRINYFCLTHMHIFRTKEIGLFICCSHEPEIAREAIENAFPEELHQMAKTEAIFSGKINPDEKNMVKRILVNKVALVREHVSSLDSEIIDRFAVRMEKTYHPFMFLV
jgi:menaquinone-dependent protoporphyrinogen oxidase